ncbi:MAG: hypothetical protein KGO94_13680 [Alphaproteobacteria bacterium]|nr:hypothetical protein [Alphaproteobacteria bacterium]
MRKIVLSFVFAAGFACAAVAETPTPLERTPQVKACREDAKAKADAYVQDYLVPATAEDTAPPGAYVAIVYGHKFLAPLRPPANGDIVQHGVGEVVAKRNQVYHEELNRCLGFVRVNLKLNQAFLFGFGE